MNRWPLTITAATPSSRGRAMVSIMLWPRRNIEILGVILLIVSSAGGFVTTTQQQTPRRYVPPRQVRRHGYSRGTPGVTTTSGTTCLLGCATNSNGGALSSNNYIARLARFQSLGLQDEVLGSSSFCGASQRRYLHPGSRATLLMMSPPLPSQTHHSQGDSARNGETGAKKEPLVRPPSRKINAWHLPGVPVVPKAAESAANVTASPNSTSPITTSNISKTVDVNAQNSRSLKTASAHTTSDRHAVPVSAGAIGTKTSNVTAEVSPGEPIPRKKEKKLKLLPRSPVPGRVRRRPLVVRDGMDLVEVTSLVQEVLERVSDTERELRRLRKEGSLPKARSSVAERARKFVIDKRATMIGAAFAGCLAGMIVGWSVLPNLWLVGGVAGAVSCSTLSRTQGTVGSLCATCGIQVALIYKDIRDWWEQTVFLYKTGKLSYAYWKGFEKYDKAWGLTEKYNGAVNKISKEAADLDRQYKIRAKAVRARKRVTKFSKQARSSAAKEMNKFANTATDWGNSRLKEWGVVVEKPDDVGRKRFRLRLPRKWRRDGNAAKRPLGLSFGLGGIFGGEKRSFYSPPPAGGTRKPGYRGDPVIPARIRHIFMTPKQIREERLRKYRVGFMGMQPPRRFDRND